MFRACLTVVVCLVAMSAASECSGTDCAAEEASEMRVSMLQVRKQTVIDQESVEALEARRIHIFAELAHSEKEISAERVAPAPSSTDPPSVCSQSDDFMCTFSDEYKASLCAGVWYQTHCKYKCGLCEQEGIAPTPIPTDPPSACSQSDDPMCTFSDELIASVCAAEWYRTNCKYECGLCEQEGVAPTPISPDPPSACSQSDDPMCTFSDEYTASLCAGEWYQTNCKYKCGLCEREGSPDPSSQCSQSNHTMCKFKAGFSDEFKATFCILEWYQTNCKFECGLCAQESVAPTPAATDPSSECFQSSDTMCTFSDKLKASVCAGEWYQTHCKYECGLCNASTPTPTGPTSECAQSHHTLCKFSDEHKASYCYYEWYQTNCKFECGLCEQDDVAPTPLATDPASECFQSNDTMCTFSDEFKANLCARDWYQTKCRFECGLCT